MFHASLTSTPLIAGVEAGLWSRGIAVIAVASGVGAGVYFMLATPQLWMEESRTEEVEALCPTLPPLIAGVDSE